MSKDIEIIHYPGLTLYAPVYADMIARRDAIARGEAGNALFLVEHTSVVTLGREWKEDHLLRSRDELAAAGVDVIEVDRGGDVTYHGPGQLVAYPLLNLHDWRPSVGWYLRTLEQVLIDVCATYGLQGERLEGLTGVWVHGAKVAAVGVGLRRWVTCHGIALNIAPNMAHFGYIIPCGISDKPVTSLTQLLGKTPPFEEVRERFVVAFRERFS